MRRLASALILAGLLCMSAGAAHATIADVCCACAAERGTTAGLPTPALIPALFCGEFPTAEPAAARCAALHGGLICVGDIDGQAPPLSTCSELLRSEEGIACPITAGAPVGHAWGLVGLAAALLTGGIVAVRRRARA